MLIPVETHVIQPCELVYVLHLRVDQLSGYLTLVNQVCDELLVLFTDFAG